MIEKFNEDLEMFMLKWDLPLIDDNDSYERVFDNGGTQVRVRIILRAF